MRGRLKQLGGNLGMGLIALSIGILALAIKTAAPTSAASASTAAPVTHTLTLDSRFTSSDVSGRLELVTDQLSNAGHVVGHDVVACDLVTSTQNECAFTEFINGHGTFQVQGFQGNTNAPVAMAIVGGTGDFVGASGTMTTSDEDTSVEHYLLRYTLPSS
jgi:hypothetical protein